VFRFRMLRGDNVHQLQVVRAAAVQTEENMIAQEELIIIDLDRSKCEWVCVLYGYEDPLTNHPYSPVQKGNVYGSRSMLLVLAVMILSSSPPHTLKPSAAQPPTLRISPRTTALDARGCVVLLWMDRQKL
jgi:hypothetical protein